MAVTKLWAIKARTDGKISSVRRTVASVTKYAENPEKTDGISANTSNSNDGEGISFFADEEKGTDATIDSVLSYVERDNATHEKKYVSTINCTEMYSIEEMMITKERFHERGNRVLWHGYQSFMPGEVTPDTAHKIGVRMAEELWGDRYQVVVTTHLDKEHIHNHIVINSVSFLDGKKFNWDKEFPRMQAKSDELCRENGLSVPEKDELSGHYHRGAVRAKSTERYTLEEITREDIDCCIVCSSSYDGFLDMMKDKGYWINTEGKYVRVYPPGHDKAIRIDRRWGENYTIEGIKNRIEKTSSADGDDIISEEDGSFINDKEIPSDGNVRFYGKNFTNDRTTDEYLKMISKDVNKGMDIFKMTIPYHILKYILTGYNIHIPGKYIGRSLTGLMVGFAMYHMAVGVFRQTPRQVSRTHFLLREDLTKMDRYVEETKFLLENDIKTEEDLELVAAGKKAVQRKLRTERLRLRNHMKKAGDVEKVEIKNRIKEINKALETERKEVFYCDDIKNRMREIVRKRKLIHEKKSRIENVSEDGISIGVFV